jgi:hypothetical protein
MTMGARRTQPTQERHLHAVPFRNVSIELAVGGLPAQNIG